MQTANPPSEPYDSCDIILTLFSVGEGEGGGKRERKTAGVRRTVMAVYVHSDGWKLPLLVNYVKQVNSSSSSRSKCMFGVLWSAFTTVETWRDQKCLLTQESKAGFPPRLLYENTLLPRCSRYCSFAFTAPLEQYIKRHYYVAHSMMADNDNDHFYALFLRQER